MKKQMKKLASLCLILSLLWGQPSQAAMGKIPVPTDHEIVTALVETIEKNQVQKLNQYLVAGKKLVLKPEKLEGIDVFDVVYKVSKPVKNLYSIDLKTYVLSIKPDVNPELVCVHYNIGVKKIGVKKYIEKLSSQVTLLTYEQLSAGQKDKFEKALNQERFTAQKEGILYLLQGQQEKENGYVSLGENDLNFMSKERLKLIQTHINIEKISDSLSVTSSGAVAEAAFEVRVKQKNVTENNQLDFIISDLPVPVVFEREGNDGIYTFKIQESSQMPEIKIIDIKGQVLKSITLQ